MPVLEMPIKMCRPSKDTVPFTECRNSLTDVMERTRRTHRPMLITQNGRAASYIVAAGDFDALMEKIELWNDIAISRRQIAEGEGESQEEVFGDLHSKLVAMRS